MFKIILGYLPSLRWPWSAWDTVSKYWFPQARPDRTLLLWVRWGCTLCQGWGDYFLREKKSFRIWGFHFLSLTRVLTCPHPVLQDPTVWISALTSSTNILWSCVLISLESSQLYNEEVDLVFSDLCSLATGEKIPEHTQVPWDCVNLHPVHFISELILFLYPKMLEAAN